MSLCTLSAILQRRNASWDSKSVHHFLSGKISWWILSKYFLENKFSISFLSTLSSTKGLLVSLKNFWGEENTPAMFDEHDDPRIFPTVCTDNMQEKHYSPLICCSNGNHTEHNASSAFYNLPCWKTALSSSLSTSPFLQRMPRVYSNSRIHTQLTNLIKGPCTLSQF